MKSHPGLANNLGGESGKSKKFKTKPKKFEWLPRHQSAFNEIKRIVSRDVTLAYPNFSKRFMIYTDTSDYQLGSVITQEGRPLAFYSRKMNKSQMNYKATEKELVSIVETLKEFRGILLGHELKIYTDHKNLEKLTPQRPLKGLCVGEYSWKSSVQKLFTSKGGDNTVADALSRLPNKEKTQEKGTLDAMRHIIMPRCALPCVNSQNMGIEKNPMLRTMIQWMMNHFLWK